MVLKKILSKKKGQPKYFLEVEVKDQAPETPVVESSEKTPETSQAQGTKTAPSAPAPKAPVNSYSDQPEWVKAIKNYSTPNPDNSTPAENTNFAGQYISNDVPQARRRPGGSLKLFKDIASQINK
ncbi:hypothetical protein A5482_009115 [Cyanobacterium sp. IPPAS B-1200]|uniref:hypothetical protein n=1 Tax=Cyanobacterium sp. IPPAS B-1200 TaxID=1562720 RepID=UPI0008524F3A|nr:hypothetical protein [Cyanobacterium sp. IPPAS B-1200]OEJ77456.1 hypothetical protein A5482_06040 [Cyanobacterium sp. IPPAS B-1200]